MKRTLSITNNQMSEKIYLNVGGTRFETTYDTLSKSGYFNSLIRFEGKIKSSMDDPYFIDRDGHIFKHVLSLCRNPNYKYPEKYKDELEYYQIKFDVTYKPSQNKINTLLLDFCIEIARNFPHVNKQNGVQRYLSIELSFYTVGIFDADLIKLYNKLYYNIYEKNIDNVLKILDDKKYIDKLKKIINVENIYVSNGKLSTLLGMSIKLCLFDIVLKLIDLGADIQYLNSYNYLPSDCIHLLCWAHDVIHDDGGCDEQTDNKIQEENKISKIIELLHNNGSDFNKGKQFMIKYIKRHKFPIIKTKMISLGYKI